MELCFLNCASLRASSFSSLFDLSFEEMNGFFVARLNLICLVFFLTQWALIGMIA